MRMLALALTIGLVACAEAGVCEPEPESIAAVQLPLQYSCGGLDAVVDLDPASADYSRAECSVFEGQDRAEHPEFCDCTQPGYSPLTPSQQEAAADEAASYGSCSGPCCESLCFCELDQLTGDELSACQSGTRLSKEGWCFVAPNQGLGEMEAIERIDYSHQAKCPDPRAIVYTGNYLDGTRVVSCWH